MTDCLMLVDNLPFSKQAFNDLVTKYFSWVQKTFKNSAGIPSMPGVLLLVRFDVVKGEL